MHTTRLACQPWVHPGAKALCPQCVGVGRWQQTLTAPSAVVPVVPAPATCTVCTQCCKNFPPVFRHFFLESFPHPSEWFEARTRYTRSTAVASMAGAVIGLGDRHLGNILLDMHSAEVGSVVLLVALLKNACRILGRLSGLLTGCMLGVMWTCLQSLARWPVCASSSG